MTDDRWIPVSERLPEKGEVVLVYILGGYGIHAACWGYGWWYIRYDGTPIDEFISHWMPLPEGPG